MTKKATAQQVPFGDDNQKGKSKSNNNSNSDDGDGDGRSKGYGKSNGDYGATDLYVSAS